MKRPLTPAEFRRLFADDKPTDPKPATRRKKGAVVGVREAEARRVREEMAAAKG